MNKKGIIGIAAGVAGLIYGGVQLIKGKRENDIEVEAEETCVENEETDCEEESDE